MSENKVEGVIEKKVGHSELVERARRWLKNKHGVVCSEVACYAPEVPDAIGFTHMYSTVVECKASRADFLRDKKKWHRDSTTGMGNYRYYLCVPGLIKPEEVRAKWGLLYCYPRTIGVAKEAERVQSDTYPIMFSLLRRAVLRGFNPNECVQAVLAASGIEAKEDE